MAIKTLWVTDMPHSCFQEEAEGREALHHLPAQAHHSDQDDVGDRHAAQLLPEPGPLNAQEDQGCPGEPGADDKVLVLM